MRVWRFARGSNLDATKVRLGSIAADNAFLQVQEDAVETSYCSRLRTNARYMIPSLAVTMGLRTDERKVRTKVQYL